jgi:hypothetical protein
MLRLLAAVNLELTAPFEQFVAEQGDLLRRHISLLSPQAHGTAVSTVGSAKTPSVDPPRSC